MIQLFTELPSAILITFACLVLLFLSIILSNTNHQCSLIAKSLLSFSIGLWLAVITASTILDNRISKELEGKNLLITGNVISMPEIRDDGIRFRFNVESASLDDTRVKLNGIIRLGWYQQRQIINAGEKWQLKVRLKAPSGFMNPGGFDYEKWLFTERIIATGYVRKSDLETNTRLQKSNAFSINHLRQLIHQNIQSSIENKNSSAVISALVVAVRDTLNEEQWETFQKTGTSHLIAISGLHIAIVASFAFFPILLIWRLVPRLNEYIPLQIAAGFVSIIFASLYALLAGFTLPTQRALLMVIIGVFGLISRKNYPSSAILALALVAVLLIDPLAGMTISFWLSFSAVAFILFFINRRSSKPLLIVIQLQIFLSLLMMPLTLIFFANASLVSPLANLIAIPVVSLLVVPISLLGLMAMPLGMGISELFFSLSSFVITYLYKCLQWLSDTPWSSISSADSPPSYLLLALLGLGFIFLPRGFPARWLGIVFMLPALMSKPQSMSHGAFSYALLDVGQGMASVVQTKNHTLVYDTGIKLSESFDIGKLVLIPYLQSKGIEQLDTLVISHEDIDHRGGAESLLDQMKVETIISSDTTLFPDFTINECQQGQTWQWDGVNFEFLSPPTDYTENDNNRSCVLRISNAHQALLITGDILHRTEKALINSIPNKLKSTVITVPHHGSKTSSSDPFITATSAKLGLVTAGYRSRFGHPKPAVLKRYQRQNILVLNTADQGAIIIDFPSDDSEFTIQSYRINEAKFWHR